MADGERLIREIWRRWNEGDRGWDPGIVDPELEIRSMLTGRTYRGRAEVEQWMAEIDEQFEQWNLHIDEVEEVAADRFLLTGKLEVRGRQSGVDLDQPLTWVVVLRATRMLLMGVVWGRNTYEAAKAQLDL